MITNKIIYILIYGAFFASLLCACSFNSTNIEPDSSNTFLSSSESTLNSVLSSTSEDFTKMESSENIPHEQNPEHIFSDFIPEYDLYSGSDIYISDISCDNTSISFVLNSRLSNLDSVGYGHTYYMQKKNGSVWEYIEPTNDIMVEDEMFFLQSETAKIREEMKYKLETSNYRLLFPININEKNYYLVYELS